ncbi:MAG: NAD-dependent epimerase/dehydratase family protein [Chloroflexota bacterium]|nr:NAD-dependent epimerase/dehydratase family protein [Chloroflexota bacterium]
MVTNPSVRFKHAFVTGATGIVGTPLCEMIARLGIPVTAYSRNPTVFSGFHGVRHELGDILDLVALRNAAKDADVIFHVAAAVHNSVATREVYERVNVIGTQNVIQVAREINAKVIYVSSVNVDEFLRGELVNDYARSKSQAEDLIGLAAHDGLDAVILRSATVFGAQLGIAGLIVDRILDRSLKILPAPSRKISAVWSHDLAVALISAAEVGRTGHTYTIAGPTMTTADFVHSIMEALGVSLSFLSLPVWIAWFPLQLAWRLKVLTRWTPPISVESLTSHSIHDGRDAATELSFSYTPLSEIFTNSKMRHWR